MGTQYLNDAGYRAMGNLLLTVLESLYKMKVKVRTDHPTKDTDRALRTIMEAIKNIIYHALKGMW